MFGPNLAFWLHCLVVKHGQRKFHRGTTLVEVLIATGLLAGLATLVTAFFITVLRSTGENYEKSGLQSEASVILRYIESDLESAHSSKILTTQPGGPGTDFFLSIQQIDGVDVNGFLRWKNQAVIYRWDSTRTALIRKVWPPDTASLGIDFETFSPPTLTETQLETMATTPNQTERQFSQRVILFSFRQQLEALWQLRLILDHPSIPNSRMEFSRRIFLGS